MSSYIPITVLTNEALDFIITATNAETGEALPLTNYAAASWVKENPWDGTPAAQATVTIPYGGATSNQLRVYFPRSAISALDISQHWYDVIITPSGGDPQNLQHGPLFVRQGITT